MPNRLARLLCAAALAFAAAAPGSALAEPTDAELAAARDLFKQGKDLEAEGKWGDAVARFKKVGAVKMTPQVRFHIALCDEHLGRFVSAINGFELAADEARQAGALATDVAQNAPPRAEALRKRVPTLRLEVTGLRSSQVLIDGSPVARAMFGTDLPEDPGPHVVEVKRRDETVFKKEITLAERARETLTVPVDDPEDEPSIDASGDQPPDRAKPPPDAPVPSGGGPSRAPAYVATGLGVASFAGAGVFYGLRAKTISDIEATCKPGSHEACARDQQATADRGKTYTTVANVLIGVGAASAVTAVVLFVVLRPKKPAAASVGVALTAGGATVCGAF